MYFYWDFWLSARFDSISGLCILSSLSFRFNLLTSTLYFLSLQNVAHSAFILPAPHWFLQSFLSFFFLPEHPFLSTFSLPFLHSPHASVISSFFAIFFHFNPFCFHLTLIFRALRLFFLFSISWSQLTPRSAHPLSFIALLISGLTLIT